MRWWQNLTVETTENPEVLVPDKSEIILEKTVRERVVQQIEESKLEVFNVKWEWKKLLTETERRATERNIVPFIVFV